ncbi:hypothetical protein PV11_02113 [Exophiala sideris]|uniref:Uncharacterized protein n=1 Tax=Exophiala sideris TaxID=1016849 RepID=A0A0D1ZI70_9EURO|nr:hypothetical protein PV11_02113 [Exophiala sideris]
MGTVGYRNKTRGLCSSGRALDSFVGDLVLLRLLNHNSHIAHISLGSHGPQKSPVHKRLSSIFTCCEGTSAAGRTAGMIAREWSSASGSFLSDSDRDCRRLPHLHKVTMHERTRLGSLISRLVSSRLCVTK